MHNDDCQDYKNATTMCLFNNAELSKERRIFIRLLYLLCPTKALKIALCWVQPKTYLHCRRVEALSVEVGGKYSKLFKRHINKKYLKEAAFFHDIGKLCIKSEILGKKSLSIQEKRLLRKHPALGAMIVMGILATPVKQAISAHHEELDGSGYPRKIKGKNIFVITRIVSTVDDYCAMTESRGYNVPFGKREAITELEKDVGSRYDSRVLSALSIVANHDEPRFGK